MKKKLLPVLSLVLALSLFAPAAFAKVTAPTDALANTFVEPKPQVSIAVEGDKVTIDSKGNNMGLHYYDFDSEEGDSIYGSDSLAYEGLTENREYTISVYTDNGTYDYGLDGKLQWLTQQKATQAGQDSIGISYENGKVTSSTYTMLEENADRTYCFDADGNLNMLYAGFTDENGVYIFERYYLEDGKWMHQSTNENGEEEITEVKGSIDKALAKYDVRVRVPVIFPHNTVCAAGLSLREENPSLTKKWYHVVPIDLTKDGDTELPLVASNLFQIGKATVSVKDGKVTVSYAYQRGNMAEEKRLLNWFTSIDEITADYLNAPEGKFEFGKEVDIAKELNGAKVGYLFILNTITYSEAFTADGNTPPRYDHGSTQNQQAREAMRGLK